MNNIIPTNLINKLADLLSDRNNKELAATYLFSKPSDYPHAVLQTLATKLIEESKKKGCFLITLNDPYCGGAYFSLALGLEIQSQNFEVKVNITDKIYSKKNDKYEFVPFDSHRVFIGEVESLIRLVCSKSPSVKFNQEINFHESSLNVLIFDPTVRGESKKTAGANEHLRKLSFTDSSKIVIGKSNVFDGDKSQILNPEISSYDLILTLKQNSKFFQETMVTLTKESEGKVKSNSLRKVIHLQIESQNLHTACIDENSLNKIRYFAPEKYEEILSKVEIKGDSNQIQVFKYVDQKVVDTSQIKERYFKVNIADNNCLVEILSEEDSADSLASKRVQEAYDAYLNSIKSVVPDVSIYNYLEKLYQLKEEI